MGESRARMIGFLPHPRYLAAAPATATAAGTPPAVAGYASGGSAKCLRPLDDWRRNQRT